MITVLAKLLTVETSRVYELAPLTLFQLKEGRLLFSRTPFPGACKLGGRMAVRKDQAEDQAPGWPKLLTAWTRQ